MPILVICECGQKFAAADPLAGKTLKCRKCGKSLTVPVGQASPRPAPASPKSNSSIADLLDEAGITPSKTGRRCRECGADMTPEAILCVQCGWNTETGKRLGTKRDIMTAGR